MFNPARRKRKRSVRDSVDGSLDSPISEAYDVLDTDLARDNMENDLSDADLQDLEGK